MAKLKLTGQVNLLGKSRVVLKWNEVKVSQILFKRLRRNLTLATRFYHGEVIRIFKTQPWGSRAVGGGLRRKSFRSSPSGRPPFKQTGNLANSPVFNIKGPQTAQTFFSGIQGIRGRISTEVKYAKSLELGGTPVRIPQTQKIHTAVRLVNPIPKRKTPTSIAPRPVWIPLLRRLTPKLLKILAK